MEDDKVMFEEETQPYSLAQDYVHLNTPKKEYFTGCTSKAILKWENIRLLFQKPHLLVELFLVLSKSDLCFFRSAPSRGGGYSGTVRKIGREVEKI